jgi:hypothetical protein
VDRIGEWQGVADARLQAASTLPILAGTISEGGDGAISRASNGARSLRERDIGGQK